MNSEQIVRGQLPLPFNKFDQFDFEQFLPGANTQVIDYLVRLISGQERGPVYIWGDKNTGKSHLLQAVCTHTSSMGKKVAYIPLANYSSFASGLLEGLEHLDIICIDDLHDIAGDDEWELALFNLFNLMYDVNKPLVFAANVSPRGLPVKLADLKSRLSWGVTFHLNQLSEDERFAVLRQRAEARGLVLSDEMTEYLAKRVPRDMHSLLNFLDRLDKASLVAKKKLTIPFIRDLLEQDSEQAR